MSRLGSLIEKRLPMRQFHILFKILSVWDMMGKKNGQFAKQVHLFCLSGRVCELWYQNALVIRNPGVRGEQHMKDKYSWDWFRSEMVARMTEKEKAVSNELNIVQVIDRLAQTTLAHASSPFSNRPQDFVSCSMLANSFRMVISSCAQILLGYFRYPS